MPPPKKVPDDQKLEIKCAATGATAKTNPKADKSPGLPPGWKEIKGQTYSPAGVKLKFFRLAHSVAVAGVAEGYAPEGWPTNEEARKAWQAFRKAFRASSRESGEFLNLVIRHLALADTEPLERVEGKAPKLPKLPQPAGLLAQLRVEYPQLDSQSAGALLRRAQSRYVDDRYDIRARRSVSLPSFRLPAPVPCPHGELYTKDGVFYVKVRVAGQRFTLRLAGGKNWQRQLTGLRAALLHGDVGEIVLRDKRVAAQGTPPKASQSNGPGRNRTPTRLMASIAVLQPRPANHNREGALTLRTGGGVFWNVTINGETQPPYHEAQALKWGAEYRRIVERAPADTAQHAERLQGFADDQKHDRRFPRRERPDIQGAREKVVLRHRNRIDDLCKKLCRSIVLLCQRRCIGVVTYDDADDSYMSSFPWFDLRGMLKNKLEAEHGIGFVHQPTPKAQPASAGDEEEEDFDDPEEPTPLV